VAHRSQAARLLWAALVAACVSPREIAADDLAPIPVAPGVSRPAALRQPFLRRVHDLQKAFEEGEGTFVPLPAPESRPGEDARFDSSELPWLIKGGRGSSARLVTWVADVSAGNYEATPAMVLRAGESWCTPPLAIDAGARLRFEPAAIPEGPAQVRVRYQPSSGAAETWTVPASVPRTLSANSQVDRPVPGGRTRICLEAVDGTIAVGEARILAPEPPGVDPRPRWIVVTIMDTLRADAVADAPALSRLFMNGRVFTRAVSPGSHTQAAVIPVLAGRDLMRIDPFSRSRGNPQLLPLRWRYARSNLPVTHYAQGAGYHTVYVGNNGYFEGLPAFARASNRGGRDLGTVHTIQLLPAMMERYHDERVFAVYYVSTPHEGSTTPLRLFEAGGCARLTGIERDRCAYRARVRHADEAMDALVGALEAYALGGHTLHVATADHGQAFHDTIPLQAARFGPTLGRLDEGHGNTCHWNELHVPLAVVGPGVAPSRWASPVSTLDIVPTLLRVMGLESVGRLDGVALPGVGGPAAAPADRALVSYGYCSEALTEGDRQFLFWHSECARRQTLDGRPVTHRMELRVGGAPVATELTQPERVDPLLHRLRSWIGDRLAGEALVLEPNDLPRCRLAIEVSQGRIVDYGPSSTVHGLDRIRSVSLDPAQRRLSVDLDGYRGRYYVATSPADVPFRVTAEGCAPPLTGVGPLQLPFAILGAEVDPTRRRELLVAHDPAYRWPENGVDVRLRLWRQGYLGSDSPTANTELLDFSRMMREWGYIR
jgi:hypothetical protein